MTLKKQKSVKGLSDKETESILLQINNLTREENFKNKHNILTDIIKFYTKSKQLTKQHFFEEQLDNLEKRESELVEFPYIETLKPYELEKLKVLNLVYVDPGKRSLIYTMNNKGKFFQYSNKQRVKETKRRKYSRLLQNYRNKKGISTIENKLKDYPSKTCDYLKFKDFIKVKIDVNNLLKDRYKEETFRKYKWYLYINTQKSEDKMINMLIKNFGTKDKGKIVNDIALVYGDWSNTSRPQMKNFISTPGIGLKRRIAKQIKIYNIDEYKTSSLSFKTEEVCQNLWINDNRNIYKKIHAVLMYKTESKRLGCINRDKNALRNMKKITDSIIKTGKRPDAFSREQLKTTTLSNSVTQVPNVVHASDE